MKFRLSVAILLVLTAMISSCAEKGVREYTIEQFMDNVIVSGGYFSHDEKNLLVTMDESKIFNAYRIPISGGPADQLTDSRKHSVFALSYFPEDNRFLYLSDKGGNEIYHIYLRDEDGIIEDLTPEVKARALFYGWTKNEDNFVFGSNKRDSKYMDIYLMDIETLTPKMIYLNDAGYNFAWISDDMRYMAFSRVLTEHDTEMYIYDRETGEMRHISEHTGDIIYTPLEFSKDSNYLYYLTDEESEFTYLKKYELATGKSETVEKADWDISFSYCSWNGTYRATGINNDGRTEIRIYRTETGELVELPAFPDGVISSVGFSKSERYMRFHLSDPRSTNNLFVYDFETGKYRKLTDSMNPEINRNDLVEPEIVRYRSFDDEVIPALYFKPKGIKPGESVPAIVYVHGGPGGQARVGYSALLQYLVNHGYAVLAVNNRGSSGYGKRFSALDDHSHGNGDLRDCVEGKNWLIKTGYVDPGRIGILGGSYGGYIVLAALAFQPEEFAAGVDLFGISNWVRTLSNIPPWWENYRDALYKEIGDPETDEEYLKSISPLFHAENIKRPLMVLQGANDPRVFKIESDEIVEAARRNGAVVEYMVFDDEGHGFLKKENRLAGYGAVLKFLDRHLKNSDRTN
ncbi:MAG: S9 family peptidase [Candidatus Krumholzibacteriota bacterium]|nr:S9 family peptidase [Candidatus Krumholzibacteriota bacterium]